MSRKHNIDALLADINAAPEQANPTYLIDLFEQRMPALDQAPHPIKQFHNTYLNRKTPSASLNKTGMLMYLPQLKEQLEQQYWN